MMTVSQLIAYLSRLPKDMGVLYCAYSDYNPLEVDQLKTVKAVPQGEWYMRAHPTMSDANKLREREYFLLPGN
jgi:hypothetical protein